MNDPRQWLRTDQYNPVAPERDGAWVLRARPQRLCPGLGMPSAPDQGAGKAPKLETGAGMAGRVMTRVSHVNQEIPCIMDGQESLWTDARSHLAGFELIEILDLLHVTNRVWEAAHLFHAEGSSDAKVFARARIEAIIEGKVGRVIGGMRQMATKRRLKDSKRKRLETICGYLKKNRHRIPGVHWKSGLPRSR